MPGADIAFDRRILTNYFASRTYTISTYLIASVIAKAKAGFAQLASAFRAPAFASVVA